MARTTRPPPSLRAQARIDAARRTAVSATAPLPTEAGITLDTRPPAAPTRTPEQETLADQLSASERYDRARATVEDVTAQLSAARRTNVPAAELRELERVLIEVTGVAEGLLAESKRDDFKRIGRGRVIALLKAIYNLQPLADRNRYGYLDRDVTKLDDTVMEAWNTTIDLFRQGRGRMTLFDFDNGNHFTYEDEPAGPEEPEPGGRR